MSEWRKYILPAVITIILGLFSVVYGTLIAADNRNDTNIKAVKKETCEALDKKVDNKTLQLQIQLMREQNKTVQMQINMNKEQINEIKAKKKGSGP